MERLLLFVLSISLVACGVLATVAFGRHESAGWLYLAGVAMMGWMLWRSWRRMVEAMRTRERGSEMALVALAEAAAVVARERAAAPKVAFRTDGDVAIHVPDLDRALAFYGGVLGFRLVDRTADQLQYDTGAIRLWVNRDAAAVQPFIPALAVPDFREAKRHLQEAGCEIVREFPGGKGMYFRDPFGLVLDVIESAPPAPRVTSPSLGKRP